MDKTILKWIVTNGHKVLIWVQFLIAVILWITADPDPSELMAALQACIAGG